MKGFGMLTGRGAAPPQAPPYSQGAAPPYSQGAARGAGVDNTRTWTEYFKHLAYVGIPISWFALFIFAGAIPIAPMSFLGYTGINIMVTGSYGWAAVKTGVQFASYLAGQLIKAYFPNLWPISLILAYSPWYIFDLVQMFDPNFSRLGFRTPFFTTYLGSNFDPVANTFGSVTLAHMFVIFMIMLSGGYSLLDLIPSEITGNFKPFLKTVFKIVAGIAGLVGGGMMAFTTMPSMFSALRGGGTQSGGGGAKEKTLDDIAKAFMKPDGDAQMAYLFIGALLTAALGGIALSATRA